MKSKLAFCTTFMVMLLSITACSSTPAVPPTTQPVEMATQVPTEIPPTATETPPPLVIPADYIAFYPLDGDAIDQSGNGHDGIIYNIAPGNDRLGNPESALAFNGFDSVIQIPDDDGLELENNFTIDFFINGNSAYTHQWILMGKHMVGECKPATASWILRYHNEQGLFISVYDQNAECGTAYAQNNPIRLDDGAWHNVGVVYLKDTQGLKFYVDCALAYETSASMNILDNPQPFTIGNQNLGPESTALEGSLDDIRIYDRALTEEEIQAFCSAP